MPATVYALLLASGRVLTGAIHGAGGLIGGGPHNAGRVRQLIRLADRGRPLHVYEPKPGHVRMYPFAASNDFVTVTDVDVRGASLVEKGAA